MMKPVAERSTGDTPPTRRYTIDGNQEAEHRVAADQALIARRVEETVKPAHFESLVLMGGYGRGEGGYLFRDGEPEPYNDYDYFLVFRGLGRTGIRAIAPEIETLAHDLTDRVGVEVDLALIGVEPLRRAPFNLMNAEMLWGHRVVAGNPDVLSVMPRMPFHELSPGEFTRLMNNRGSLLLMNARRLASGGPVRDDERDVFFKYLFKAVLACGDARLAVAGSYHPSYVRKRENLADPGERCDEGFLSLYDLALEQKFHPDAKRLAGLSPTDYQQQAVNTWLETFQGLETARTGRPVGDWEAYARVGVDRGQLERGSVLRNTAIGLRDFPPAHLLRHPSWAYRYPRERMIAVLPLLLSEQERLSESARIPLALPAGADWATAVDTYLRRWPRYA